MVIFSGGFNGIQSILVGLADKINTPFFFILFVLCAFSAITSTVGACLHSLVSLLVANVVEPLRPLKNDRQKIRLSYLFSIVIGAILYITTLFFSTSRIELLFYSGNIYSAMIPPISTIVFSKGKVADFVAISALIAIVVGFITIPFFGNQPSIWISAVTSFSIIVICTCFKFVKNSYLKKGLL